MAKVNLKNIVNIIEELAMVAPAMYNQQAESEKSGVDPDKDKEYKHLSRMFANIYEGFNSEIEGRDKEELWNAFFMHIVQLCKANALTGFWDYQRGLMRKEYDKPGFNQDVELFLSNFATTERNSRGFCEKRALHRTSLDEIISELVK